MGTINSFTTLNGATATVEGSTIDLGQAYSHICMIVRPVGTVTGGTVTLELSHDGINFMRYANTGTIDGIPLVVASSGEAYRYARGSVTDDITGGGNVVCTIMAAGV